MPPLVYTKKRVHTHRCLWKDAENANIGCFHYGELVGDDGQKDSLVLFEFWIDSLLKITIFVDLKIYSLCENKF